jgi:hypothetical protein
LHTTKNKKSKSNNPLIKEFVLYTLDGGALKEYWVENKEAGTKFFTITIPGEKSICVRSSKLMLYLKQLKRLSMNIF